MNKESVIEIINDFLVEEFEVEEDVLLPESNLKDDVEIDSLDFVDIVVIVEKKFGFRIKQEEMVGVHTLQNFYDYVHSKVENK